MKQELISARVELDNYTNKVLTMLKAKYGLKDKSEAINKFAELYGDEIVEKEANEEYIKEIIAGVNEHIKKKGIKIAQDLKAITIIPDLYRGQVATDREHAGHLMNGLDWPGAIADILGAAKYLKSVHGCTKVGVTGFCMGKLVYNNNSINNIYIVLLSFLNNL